jgi:hypothetical protein
MHFIETFIANNVFLGKRVFVGMMRGASLPNLGFYVYKDIKTRKEP